MPELLIRHAIETDIPTILAFIRELAEYEKEPQAAVATHEDLLRDGFTDPIRFHCLIAEWSEPSIGNELQGPDKPVAAHPLSTENEERTTQPTPAGFALYFHNYSTWRGHTGIYIEDLFVRPQYRGQGIGKALLSAVAAIAVSEGCPRLEWAVLDWNTPAIDFYTSVNATPMSEWTTMRLSGEALATIASQSCFKDLFRSVR